MNSGTGSGGLLDDYVNSGTGGGGLLDDCVNSGTGGDVSTGHVRGEVGGRAGNRWVLGSLGMESEVVLGRIWESGRNVNWTRMESIETKVLLVTRTRRLRKWSAR